MTDADLKASLLAQIAKEPRPPTRAEVLGRNAGVIAIGFAAAVAMFLAGGGVREWGASWQGPNHHTRDPLLMAITFSGTFAVAAVALRVAFGRGGSMVGRPWQWLLGVVLAAPTSFFLWKVGWSEAWGDEPAWGAANSPYGFKCFGLSTAMAAALLAALITTRRGTDPIHPRVTGAALGVAAGSAAVVLTDLWCPIGNPLHVLLGHVLPMLILGILGAGPGSWWLALPPPPPRA